MSKSDIEKAWLNESQDNIVLFRPHIPSRAIEHVSQVLTTRWIGQGPKVDDFENRFNALINSEAGIAVGSGTDALHLAYLLAGIGPGDEVITPVFTCTATNIPLLYLGAKPVFTDIQETTMNMDPTDIEHRITSNTKAISCVHYGGLPCDMDEIHAIAKKYHLPVIEDAAHAVGARYKDQAIGEISDYTMFSFQAIKHITTGDGGYLALKNPNELEKAKRLRWFGIDRNAKNKGIWDNDLTEVGYKYQMTDISAAMGLAALEEWNETFSLRQALFSRYCTNLRGNPDVTLVGDGFMDRVHGAWMMTIMVDAPEQLQKKLLSNRIESNQVHFRNDRYSIFGGRRSDLPIMDKLESRYLVIPLHTHMTIEDVDRVCEVIQSGW
jgi:dTDP-4-amino-4,6-dideoxygalactose transaminase